jgi:hypothetical protein
VQANVEPVINSVNLYNPNFRTKNKPMKNHLYSMLLILAVFILLLSACSGSRQSTHHRGVDNSGYKGY